MVGVSAAFGALLARPRPDGVCLAASLGAMLLAWACSAWNQVQERRTDVLMERTACRPVASGRMPALPGALLGAGCFLAACMIFCIAGGMTLLWRAAGIALVYTAYILR